MQQQQQQPVTDIMSSWNGMGQMGGPPTVDQLPATVGRSNTDTSGHQYSSDHNLVQLLQSNARVNAVMSIADTLARQHQHQQQATLQVDGTRVRNFLMGDSTSNHFHQSRPNPIQSVQPGIHHYGPREQILYQQPPDEIGIPNNAVFGRNNLLNEDNNIGDRMHGTAHTSTAADNGEHSLKRKHPHS
jgi:hypothetical protein